MYNRLCNTLTVIYVDLLALLNVLPRASKMGTDEKMALPVITTLPEIDCGFGYYLDDLYDCQPCSPGTMDIPDCHVVDPCRKDPCENSGTCSNIFTEIGLNMENFTCYCALPYFGSTCEVLDPCLSDPCQHGGTCVFDLSLSMVSDCDCPFIYSGSTCEDINIPWWLYFVMLLLAATIIVTPIVIRILLKRKLGTSAENPSSEAAAILNNAQETNVEADLSDSGEDEFHQPSGQMSSSSMNLGDNASGNGAIGTAPPPDLTPPSHSWPSQGATATGPGSESLARADPVGSSHQENQAEATPPDSWLPQPLTSDLPLSTEQTRPIHSCGPDAML